VQKVTHRKPHHPALVILAKGIEQWLTSVLIAIQDQVVMLLPLQLQAIGSLQLSNNDIQGILSRHWSQAASIHPWTQHIEHDIGNGHVYRLIRALHGFTTGIWEAQNKQLNRRDDEEAARIQTPIDAVIKLLHSQPHLLHSVDRFRCEQSLSDILKLLWPLNKRRWVN
jgi:hypothetical protein